MTNLTEKWENGELKNGYYYLIVNGEQEIGICENHCLITVTGYDIVEVLAPVPSYDELQEFKQKKHILTESQMKLENTIGEFGQENASLKELLKEVKEFIEEENPKDFTIMSERMDELLTKIEEALK